MMRLEHDIDIIITEMASLNNTVLPYKTSFITKISLIIMKSSVPRRSCVHTCWNSTA